MRRRPLPFSRAWLAAFVLGVLAVGWTAIVIGFDIRAERAHVERLGNVVGSLENAVDAGQGQVIEKIIGDLAAVTASRTVSGAEEVDRMWDRVATLSRRASDVGPNDMEALAGIVNELKSTSNQLDEVVADGEPNAVVGDP